MIKLLLLLLFIWIIWGPCSLIENFSGNQGEKSPPVNCRICGNLSSKNGIIHRERNIIYTR